KLSHLGFDLHTNKTSQLPISADAPITCLCIGPQRLWVGTAGEGLIEHDKLTGASRLLTEKDGLLINYISSLCLHDDTLWIGYGRERAGGLGRFDLPTGKITALTPSLPSDALETASFDPADGPPRRSVFALAF